MCACSWRDLTYFNDISNDGYSNSESLPRGPAGFPDLNPEVLNDFLRCACVLQYAGMVGDCGVFKGKKINEPRDFQKHLLQALRMTDLGSEVKGGERITGRFFNLRYRNIVIELKKVSRTEKEREKIRKEYIEQPSQYAMTSIPISIACILDMTEKIPPTFKILLIISR